MAVDPVDSASRMTHLNASLVVGAKTRGSPAPGIRVSTHTTLGRQRKNVHTDDGRILNMETTEKQRAIEALKALPERATIEDAIERLCFIAKIEEGLRQSEAGQLVPHDEVKKQFLP